VVVNTAKDCRRASIRVKLGGDASRKAVRGQILAAVATVDAVLADPPPELVLQSATPTEQQVELRVWADPSTRRSVIQAQADGIHAQRGRLPDCQALTA
jgi:small-conductance mechanosensitive channel